MGIAIDVAFSVVVAIKGEIDATVNTVVMASSMNWAKVIAGAVVVATWRVRSPGMSKARSMTLTSW